MGIYDRDYYREHSSAFNPFNSRSQACIALIVIYAAIFIFQIAFRGEGDARQKKAKVDAVTELFELKASKVLDGEIWRLFTYSFIHDSYAILPIALNIWFLILFARQVEDIYHWKEFLLFYLLVGLLAGLGFTLVTLVSKQDSVLVGPASTLTAVLLLFALHYPRRTVLLFLVLPVSVWFFVGFSVLHDALGLSTGHLHPAAFAAHAIAAAFALMYFRFTLRISNWLPSFSRSHLSRKQVKPNLRIFHKDTVEDESARSSKVSASLPSAASSKAATPSAKPAVEAPTQSVLDEHLEAKLDEVLEKVKKNGQASLNDEEREILFRASQIYRNRRKS